MIYETKFDQHFLDEVNPVWEDARSYPQQVIKLTLAGAINYSAAYWEEYPPFPAHPVWAWGVFPYWEGVGEIWMLFDKRAENHTFKIVREARRAIALLEGPLWSFHRIFGQFDTRVTANYKLARLLGFREEGRMRKFDGEHEFSLYARVT